MSEQAEETQETREPDAPEPDAPIPPDLLPDEEEAEESEQVAPEAEPDESEPLAQQGLSDKEREAMFVKGEKAAAAYARKIGDIYGDEAADLIECPLCPDQHKGFVNIHFAGRVPPDVVDATRLFLGFAREQDYEPDPETKECPTCKGKGSTATGSHVADRTTRTCPTCNGAGYVPPPVHGANGAATLTALPAATETASAPIGDADRDPTGEPRVLPNGELNPNYGKWPQFKVQVPPWGVTANLTAQDAVTA